MTPEQNLTAEEIAQSYSLVDKYGAADITAVEAMKLYAIQVAEQVRLECAEKAKIKVDDTEYHERYSVDKQSILSIDLNQFIR